MLNPEIFNTKSYNGFKISSNDKTISKCVDCDMVVSGSYIVKSDNFQNKIDSLR